MFGYVQPVKGELRVRELARYNAYYCGLCRAIGERYGQSARAFLNYDCAFAAILLSGIREENEECTKHVCAFKPAKGKMPMAGRSKSLFDAADLNIILAYGKLADDIRDEKRPVAYAGRALLKGAYRKAAAAQPAAAEAVERGMGELRRLEASGCRELDAPGDAFGNLMKGCFTAFFPDDRRIAAPMEALGYNLGKWIYLADAWDDRASDAKRGEYNVFNITGADEERAAFVMNCAVNEAIAAYGLLGLASNAEILDNIIMMGCTEKTAALVGGNNGRSL